MSCSVQKPDMCMLCYSETTSMIMDCGEATYGQLVRMYGCRTGNVLEGMYDLYNRCGCIISYLENNTEN